jgi:hypothetical protein
LKCALVLYFVCFFRFSTPSQEFEKCRWVANYLSAVACSPHGVRWLRSIVDLFHDGCNPGTLCWWNITWLFTILSNCRWYFLVRQLCQIALLAFNVD